MAFFSTTSFFFPDFLAMESMPAEMIV